MATKKRKKASGIGTAIYVVILILWILFLAACGMYVLQQVWNYAAVYDQTNVEPVIEEYFSKLEADAWSDGMDELVHNMSHPTQTDAEVKDLIQNKLKSGKLSYKAKPGFTRSDSITYNLYCDNDLIGEVVVEHDKSKNLVEDVNLPTSIVGVLAKMGVAIQPELYNWKVTGESFDFTDLGLYSSVRITVPEDYQVVVNGTTLGQEYIIERDIEYDVLHSYYYEYDNLPTKVTYKLDNSMGDATVVVYDEDGNVFSVDENKSDYQFMTPLDEGTVTSLDSFITGFADKFLQMRSNTSDPVYTYGELKPYIKAGTDLDNRLKQSMIDTWSHNSYYQFNGCEITNAYYFFKDQMYVIEFHAEASAQQPAGPNVLSSDFRVLVDMSSGGPLVVEVEDV